MANNIREISEARPKMAEPPSGGDGGLGERVAKIEAHMSHMATKAWVLSGVVGGAGLAAIITLAVIRLFDTAN